MRRWLIPVALLSASLLGVSTFSWGGGSRAKTTYQLDVTLLQEATPASPGAEAPRRLAKMSLRALEGQEVKYESGGVVTFGGDSVPIGQSLHAVIRREAKGRVHLRLVLENRTLAGRAEDQVLIETQDARYSGALQLGEKVRLTFGESSGHRPCVELLAQEVDRQAE